MDQSELLFLLADAKIKARARELIGADRFAYLLAQAALEGTGEKLDAEVIARLLNLSTSGAVKRIRKNRRKPRQ